MSEEWELLKMRIAFATGEFVVGLLAAHETSLVERLAEVERTRVELTKTLAEMKKIMDSLPRPYLGVRR